MSDDPPIQGSVNDRTWKTLEEARKHCEESISKVRAVCDAFLKKNALTPDDVCCVVVGSVGRGEALAASDIDFIPVLSSNAALVSFQPFDKSLREAIRSELSVKVSQGEDLTKCISLEEITDPETIGGDKDCSAILTKRILILTESKQAGGKLPIDTVRERILSAYDETERTRGRHVLSLCNDIARYYRTLCIEYKAKADNPTKDWCTRNMKLRHSRKFWYFSCLMSIVAVADSSPQGDDHFKRGLLAAFDKTPVRRLFDAVGDQHRGMAGRVSEAFSWFLEFMASKERREKLEQVSHSARYEMSLENPFHAIKLNSDRLHQELLTLLDSLPVHQRHRIISWFLL